MRQIAVVSGKGGTGKTTLTASLAFLMKDKVVADCDVDAPNLHLILSPQIRQRFDYWGGKKAKIEQEKCVQCGVCRDVCRFDAIDVKDGVYTVNEYACEGCKACVIACPTKAIELISHLSGEYYSSTTSQGKMAHALLSIGEETSGGLVGEVRKKAIEIAEPGDEDIVIDGAPGIGCPPISSVTGVDYVVIVTEPTMSGIHDMQRIIQTISSFRLRMGVVVNKHDLNPERADEIERYCRDNGIDFLGKIPFDEKIEEATWMAKPIVAYPDSRAAKAISLVWEELKQKVELS